MCAARIEQGLKAVDGVEDAVLDFAAMTLHVKARGLERIPDAVRDIEPGVEVVPKADGVPIQALQEDARLDKRELAVLALSLIFFGAQFFWIVLILNGD